MDVATRFQPRARAQSFLDREKAALLDEQSPETESATRRKFQRTNPAASTDRTGQFRKPSIPASATRQQPVHHQRQVSGSGNSNIQRQSSLTNTQKRRTSGIIRDAVRVPSGPREYPSSPEKRNTSTNFSQTTGDAPANTATRRPSLLPASVSMPFFGSKLTYDPSSDLTRGSFGNPNDTFSDSANATLHHERDNSGSLDFLPAINFDEFQTSLGTLDTGSSFRPDLLDEFPAIGGGRMLRSDTVRAEAMASTSVHSQEQGDPSNLGREPSFRQRLADRTSRIPSDSKLPGSGQTTKPSTNVRAKRQSTYAAQDLETSPKASQRMPRSQVVSTFGQAQDQSSDLARSSSLVRARRTTMNTAAPQQITEKPRANVGVSGRPVRGKPLLSSHNSDPNTPQDKQNSKSTGNQTPSSSGNGRRQSIVSGRASGLGARTVSPTDARRQMRMSVAPQQPPLPFSVKRPPTPGEETTSSTPLQHNQSVSKFFELPRLTAAPSPSLIPTRKDSSSLASNSARASPSDGGSALGKFGYNFPITSSTPGPGGLSQKSGYTSLHNAASASASSNTQSRVPVPKARTTHSATNTTSTSDDSLDFGELIPPVPAIPKGYESPKDNEPAPFAFLRGTSSTRQPSLSHLPSSFDEGLPDNELGMLGIPAGEVMRSSFESDRARHGGSRKSAVVSRNTATAPPQTQRLTAMASHEDSPKSFLSLARTGPYQEQNGRQNSNLQPLRLPPLNLSSNSSRNIAQLPRPSQELDDRERHWASGMQTPDWTHAGHKTPSTPMTASKATFFKRHGESDKMRSSTSHLGSRDHNGLDAETLRTGWLEDSDDAGSNGMRIPIYSGQNFSRATGASRNAITPFASGSLPKGSGEYTRLHGRPSGEFADDAYFLGNSSGSYDGLRLAKAKTFSNRPNLADSFGRSLSIDHIQVPEAEYGSPAVEATEKEAGSGKKEGGLRRKLSLGWRRSSSKAATHAENSKHDAENARKDGNGMLPPRLPASVAFTGDGSLGISTSARPSLDGCELGSLTDRVRRKADAANKVISTDDSWQQENAATSKANAAQSALPKTRSMHSERPQPVSNLRSSSFGTFNRQSGIPPKAFVTQPRAAKHGHSASTISALVKDKDDLAADEEMRNLSQKKKDVDNVAKITEELLSRASPKTPVDLEQILHDRHNSLNIFERGEVVEYENDGVYFTGTKHAKKIVGSLHPSSQPVDAKDDKAAKATNYGYDDERGDYNIVFGDHLAYRYEVCDILGKGSFGQVVRCIDHKEGGVVAIKIIRNKKRFHQQALVEVGILGKLREWDPEGRHATLSITGSFYFRSHLCIVTPCLSINLYELIRAHNFSGFPLPLIRRFARQLLACLVLLQERRVIHCDLKPENILLCSARAADVRVIDFGSSCREEEKVYTYIQSRFYRSPEVILGSSYGLGIDMWSFGCILAELWTGYPIFPGENEQDQLACIMEIFGPPDRHLVERCTRKKLFFDSVGKPRVTVSSKGRRRRPSSKTLQQALKTDDDAFIDFVARCLRWDPERRLKPHEACSHAFITNQSLHQRPSIPDEARRAARVRSTAAVPAAGSTSPAKRIILSQSANALQVSIAATPQKASMGSRQPDTPQTALRAPVVKSVTQVSPAKPANRRQSTLAAAGSSAALSSSRRQSSGAALAASMNAAMAKSSGGSLAEKAAREVMAATAAANSASANAASGRWRA